MKRSDLLRKMRKSKFFMLGVAMGLILLFSVLVIPEVMELDPIKTDLKNVLSAPQWFSMTAKLYEDKVSGAVSP